MAKLPSLQFYPGDWRKDPSLSVVSLAAKGLWIDLLCLMFESERRGYLQINGLPFTTDQIAMAVRSDINTVSTALKELENAHVFYKKKIKKNEKKLEIIFSKRMVNDEKRRKTLRQNGRKGGNPAFKKGVRNPYYSDDYENRDDLKYNEKDKDNQGDNQKDNQKISPSASASSSSSSSSSDNKISKQQVFEFLRVATNREFISDLQLQKETEDFIKKYHGANIKSLRALCNTWASNIIPEKKKELVQ